MGKDRILRHLHDVAEGPWEYGNGDPMSSDAQDFILAYEQQAQTIKELQSQLQAKTEECDGLRAKVKRLRAALMLCREMFIVNEIDLPRTWDKMTEAINETPAQSLSAIRNEAIEECAVLADANFNKVYDGDYLYEIDIANAIRNLPYPQLTEEE